MQSQQPVARLIDEAYTEMAQRRADATEPGSLPPVVIEVADEYSALASILSGAYGCRSKSSRRACRQSYCRAVHHRHGPSHRYGSSVCSLIRRPTA